MGGALVAIRKQHLPNTSPKHYRSISQLSPMQQRFYWETDACWTLQRIVCLLWNQKFHFRLYKNPTYHMFILYFFSFFWSQILISGHFKSRKHSNTQS